MKVTLASGVDVEDAARELDGAWAELRRDGPGPELDGVDLSPLLGLGRGEVVTLAPDGQGLDPATTAVVVAFAPVAAKVAGDLWSKFLLPSLKRRFGEDAVKVRSEDR